MAPSASSRRTSTQSGCSRYMNASISSTPAVFSGLHHLPRLGAAHGERLLAEDVLACLRRLDRPLGVEVVGERDVHGIDRRVVEQIL